MDRRSFLGFAATSATCSLFPTLAYSNENLSLDSYRDQQKLEKVDYVKDLDQQYQIENDILPFERKEKNDFWSKPRRIFLKREYTNEQSEIFYYHNGKIDQQQYWLASYLLRDIRQKKMVYVDPKLLDLICAVQAWMMYYGNNDPISVLSGFRTLKTNAGLEGAAKNSMHLYGKAVDFRVNGLKINELASIADQFNAGGIGLYPSSNFLHLDTGGVRKWVGGSWKRS